MQTIARLSAAHARMRWYHTMVFCLAVSLILLFLWVPHCPAEQSYFFNDVEIQSRPTGTEISLNVPTHTQYVAAELSRPPQIVMNLFPLHSLLPYREIGVGDNLVDKIALRQESESVLRASVQLRTTDCGFAVFSRQEPPSIVVQVKPPENDLIAGLLDIEPAYAQLGREQTPGSWQRSTNEQNRYRIVIDPGHGGKDPGAIGTSGLQEKQVTLAVARQLYDLLRTRSDIQVFLTRDGDVSVGLDERTETANRLQADLFISIHANAAWDSRAAGIETFYNSHYTFGQGAKNVALRENASVQTEAVPSTVRTILWDLVQNQYREQSKQLCSSIQDSLVTSCGLDDRGVKTAPFYVLRGANMPAILVEVGFVSNPWEERKLRDPKFQQLLARGIYNGILSKIQLPSRP